ncbi:regulatory protein RecX [uncultured Enterovirga sp.]|uniref:regulatory protein RecX n=1 Tax=uncultured Enterovirga sp. TaxID=2026352 RepID=UPI0035CAC770
MRSDASGKTGPRPVNPAYLERAALHYLERYASTAENLRRVLARKAKKRLGELGSLDDGILADIAEVVARIVRSGLVDDRSFAEMKAGALMGRGTSTRAIRMRLKVKGVPDEAAAAALAAHEPDDLALARRYAERKRLGPFRPRPDPARRDRDLAALCRAGFPYRIAAAVLDEAAASEDDPPQLTA